MAHDARRFTGARPATRRAALALGALVALTLAAAAAPASAATVSREGDTVTVAGGDEPNDVLLVAGRGGARVMDRSGIVAGPGCTSNTTSFDGERIPVADCGEPAARVQIGLGAGDDYLVSLDNGTTEPSIPMPPLQVDGGPGKDVLRGSRAADTLLGGPGDDELRGEGGDDVVDGGAGHDDLQGDSVLTGETTWGTPVSPAFGGDRLLARDGEGDLLRCGPGTDAVVADALDSAHDRAGCESVDGLTAMRARVSRVRPAARAITVDASCSRACTGDVLLMIGSAEAKRVGIADIPFPSVIGARHIVRRGPGVVRLRIPLAAKTRATLRRALQRSGRITAFAQIVAGDNAGVRAPEVSARFVLRRGDRPAQ